jgi:dienelactone hydrolase
MTRYGNLSGALLKPPAVLLLILCAGCPQYRDPTVPGEIQHVSEPNFGGKYYLYVPSTYDSEREWALIVVCHGTEAFDTARRQIRDWAKLAEQEQFIVAAPELRGVRSILPPPLRRQLELQRQDERRILACVQHLKGGYNIGTDKVFLTGWSAGGFAVMYTGLRNPNVFRALAVLQGNFNAEYLAEVAQDIDPYQPVYVLYGSTDILAGGEGHDCVDWLHKHGAAVTEEEIAGFHKNHPKQAFGFFERVVRKVPWLHIRAMADDPADPLTVRFKTRASFEPVRYLWSFGDEATSPIASPVHTYPSDGQYTVTLTVETPKGKTVRRATEIALPLPSSLWNRQGGS